MEKSIRIHSNYFQLRLMKACSSYLLDELLLSHPTHGKRPSASWKPSNFHIYFHFVFPKIIKRKSIFGWPFAMRKTREEEELGDDFLLYCECDRRRVGGLGNQIFSLFTPSDFLQHAAEKLLEKETITRRNGIKPRKALCVNVRWHWSDWKTFMLLRDARRRSLKVDTSDNEWD